MRRPTNDELEGLGVVAMLVCFVVLLYVWQ